MVKRRKRRTLTGKREIAYQNKDIASKVMAEEFKGKSFAVYGIDVPEIRQAEPTNLPAIEANELRLDNLFSLIDGSYAIVDYESRYSEANKGKYMNYVARIQNKLYNELGFYPKLRLIIIYTADVEPGSTEPILDTGCMKLELTEAFLTGLDSRAIYDEIKTVLDAKQPLDNELLMKLIIYPLTCSGSEAKQKAIDEALTLADSIDDENALMFVYKCMLVFTDKVIDKRQAQEIRRRLSMMTKVEKIIEKEKRDAIYAAIQTEREAADNRVKTEREKADERVNAAVKTEREVADNRGNKVVKTEREKAENQLISIAKNMLLDGESVEKISRYVGLSMARLEEIKSLMPQNA